MPKHLKTTLCIPTLGRPDSLKTCLDSIAKGTVQPDEIILIEEEGELAKLRNKGLHQAKGDIVIFTDDDVEVSSFWLQNILNSFQDQNIVGVSGPSVIRPAYRLQRDLFRFKWAKRLYDYLFLERRAHLPGRITRAGTWTTGACEESCNYEGPVDYLEACNMAFRRNELIQVGGFDERYGGVGDWSEPDACYRIKALGQLWFNPRASLFHNPSRTGAFLKRKRTGARLRNYFLFSRLWIKPHPRHTLFKWWLRTYYGLKEIGLV